MSRENIKKIFEISQEEMDFLQGDTKKRANLSQAQKRLFTKAVFSTIDGVVYALKQEAIRMADHWKVELAEGEMLLARERVYELDEKGGVMERKARLRFIPNLRFAFEVYCKAHRTAFRPDYSVHTWEALRKAEKVRNRLTHPKSPEDMMVSDQELDQVLAGHAWFVSTFGLALVAIAKALEEENESLRNQVATLNARKAELPARGEAKEASETDKA
jgi:hypothetical protein